MFIEQIYTACLSQASYYIESDGEAAVIDPIREPDQYLELAEARGAKIKYVFETHFHADFVSGHLDLSKATDAPIIFGPNANTDYDCIVADDCQEFSLGALNIIVLHSPGHTLESACYLLRNADGEAHAIFTGDTLFVGDVGRPDLLDGVTTKEELASHLFRSLNKIIKPLPNEVLVYPAHGPGSSCGKNLGPETWSTIGEQKKSNYALQDMTEEEFIKTVTADLKPPPPYFFTDAKINQSGYSDIEEVISKNMVALNVEEFSAHRDEGALVLDTRPAAIFESGFIKGAVNIGLQGMYAIWAGTLLDHGTPIIIVSEPGDERESIIRLTRVGYDHVLGYLDGGQQPWADQSLPTDTINSITAEQLSEQKSNEPVLDVRRDEEFEAGHLDTAYNVPLATLESDLSRIDDNKLFYLHCKTGYRSITAASLLKRNGISNFINILGGMDSIEKTALV